MVQTPDRTARRFAAVSAALLGLALIATTHAVHTTTLPPPWGAAGASASASPEPADPTRVLLAVGDIASCDASADEQVGELAARLQGTIALLGDIAYDRGSLDDFLNCFDPTWGQLRGRLRPAPGNHEYETKDAAGYFAYFGAVAGNPAEGWYSYDLGALARDRAELELRRDRGLRAPARPSSHGWSRTWRRAAPPDPVPARSPTGTTPAGRPGHTAPRT